MCVGPGEGDVGVVGDHGGQEGVRAHPVHDTRLRVGHEVGGREREGGREGGRKGGRVVCEDVERKRKKREGKRVCVGVEMKEVSDKWKE